MVMDCINSSLAKSFWKNEHFKTVEYNDQGMYNRRVENNIVLIFLLLLSCK